MKKSIIYLGLVVVLSSFATTVEAANLRPVATLENKVQNYGEATPLHVAIYKGDLEFIKKLIEFGADVNEKSYGLTPLMIAARYNKVEIMKLLIAKGAKVEEKTSFGADALKYAQLSNAKEAYVFLQLNKENALAQR
ncbi:ankyrin repeat domain-containing protein [Flavobacterium polysaccharolyticum]|uniref:Ankyrin repeat domain-containing protein n=1 Tax=Flavobacterium polysaccharolyticum TaxID=3133148 RepID=A0ABU9NTT6_9FLAO